MRIKVLHLVDSLSTGGVEVGLRRLVNSLEHQTFEHSVCVVRDTPDQIGGFDVPLLHLRKPQRPGFLIPEFWRLFRRLKPHIVHTRNWGTMEAIPAAKLAGVPGIVHVEHGRDIQGLNADPWRRRMFRRLCFMSADRLFAVSATLRDFYIHQQGIPQNQIGVLNDAVDTEQFRRDPRVRAELRRELQADESTLVVACVARLDRIKDHPTLLKAIEVASKACDLRLVLIGDGPERENLQRECNAKTVLKERVKFLGQIENVRDWLSAADVFAMSSLSEGTSIALLEAMAMEVAPIVTRVGGNPDLVKDGISGVLFEVGLFEALADNLVRTAKSPGWRNQIASNARQRVVENFGFESFLQTHAEIYKEVLRAKADGNRHLANSISPFLADVKQEARKQATP